MATLDDVTNAHRRIADATEAYRQTLRAALDAGVTQQAIATRLRVSTEKLRLDALTDAERDEIRRRNRERGADVRARAKRNPDPAG